MPLTPMTPNLFRIATDPFASPAQVARQARRSGYEAPDRYTAYVLCPLCRTAVHAAPDAVAGRSGDSATVFPALDSAMVAHVTAVHR